MVEGINKTEDRLIALSDSIKSLLKEVVADGVSNYMSFRIDTLFSDIDITSDRFRYFIQRYTTMEKSLIDLQEENGRLLSTITDLDYDLGAALGENETNLTIIEGLQEIIDGKV